MLLARFMYPQMVHALCRAIFARFRSIPPVPPESDATSTITKRVHRFHHVFGGSIRRGLAGNGGNRNHRSFPYAPGQ